MIPAARLASATTRRAASATTGRAATTCMVAPGRRMVTRSDAEDELAPGAKTVESTSGASGALAESDVAAKATETLVVQQPSRWRGAFAEAATIGSSKDDSDSATGLLGYAVICPHCKQNAYESLSESQDLIGKECVCHKCGTYFEATEAPMAVYRTQPNEDFVGDDGGGEHEPEKKRFWNVRQASTGKITRRKSKPQPAIKYIPRPTQKTVSPYPPCWGGDTRVFVEGIKEPVRLADVKIGDKLRTARGVYRAVQRVWIAELSLPCAPGSRANLELCRFRGYWTTSHHPVLLRGDGRGEGGGDSASRPLASPLSPSTQTEDEEECVVSGGGSLNQWTFPADHVQSWLASEARVKVPEQRMYDMELEGHDDTIVLGADDGSHRLTVACGLGKYLGQTDPATGQPRFGVFTRCTTQCDAELKQPGSCQQCSAAFEPRLRFDAICADWRWRTDFDNFPSVEWPQWRTDGCGGCAALDLRAMARAVCEAHNWGIQNSNTIDVGHTALDAQAVEGLSGKGAGGWRQMQAEATTAAVAKLVTKLEFAAAASTGNENQAQ